jgi:CRP/FNR family cyclic AMP-dependent transcriptional regulator
MNLSENDNTAPACELEQNLNLLRQTYFFSTVPVEALKVFAYLCQREEFGPGEHLFRQGEDDGQAFYVIEGTVVLEHTEAGRTQLIRQGNQGDFFGGLALLGKLRRLYSLKATSKVICLVLARSKYAKTWAQFPEITPKMVQSILNTVVEWEDRMLSGQMAQSADCLSRMGLSAL